MEQEGDCLLFGDLSVEITLNIGHLSLHTGIGSQEEIWVSSIQITKIAGGSRWTIQADQVELFFQQVPPVLEYHFWVHI